LLEQLGAADRSRLESLLGLVEPDGAIPLGAALAAVFPALMREAALTAFQQLRERIRNAAAEVSVNFSLDADGKTWTAPEKRVCWFAGDNSAVKELTAVGNMETAGFWRGAQDILEPTEMLRIDRKRVHRARVDAWNEKRREQRSWFTRTGADTVERRHRRLLAQKTAIEHQLMELMTGPIGGFAVGEPAFNS
jgi:hypothetical protein